MTTNLHQGNVLDDDFTPFFKGLSPQSQKDCIQFFNILQAMTASEKIKLKPILKRFQSQLEGKYDDQ